MGIRPPLPLKLFGKWMCEYLDTRTWPKVSISSALEKRKQDIENFFLINNISTFFPRAHSAHRESLRYIPRSFSVKSETPLSFKGRISIRVHVFCKIYMKNVSLLILLRLLPRAQSCSPKVVQLIIRLRRLCEVNSSHLLFKPKHLFQWSGLSTTLKF